MVNDRDIAREPCPDRIVEDLGGAFGMGCIGGFIWHYIKGCRNSPRGEVLSGGLYSAKMRAPILGGNFAVWGGTFSAFDCSFQYIRQKEDHWNAIASGFCTGGVLALRGGWRSATRNAIIGGVLLSIIELVSSVLTRKTTPTPRHQFQQQMEYEKMIKSMEEQKNNNHNNNLLSSSSSTPSISSFFSSSSSIPSSSSGSSSSSNSSSNAFMNFLKPIKNEKTSNIQDNELLLSDTNIHNDTFIHQNDHNKFLQNEDKFTSPDYQLQNDENKPQKKKFTFL